MVYKTTLQKENEEKRRGEAKGERVVAVFFVVDVKIWQKKGQKLRGSIYK